MERKMLIGRKLTMLMYDKKIDNSDLAEAIKISEQSVSNLKNNKTIPKLNTAIAIAEFFGITVEELTS